MINRLLTLNCQEKMKKISMMLFGAMIALSAIAQTNQNGENYVKGEWRVDSTLTTRSDGSFKSRQVIKYTEAGLISEILGEEANGDDTYKTKTTYTYNEQGQLATQESYELKDGEYSLLSKSEVKEYDSENGMPKVIVSTSSTAPGTIDIGLSTSKTVITKWHGNQFEEEEVYVQLGEEWKKLSTVKATFDDADQMVEMVTESEVVGVSMTTEVTYEYDAHGYPTKETTKTSLGTNAVMTYANEYDENDNLVKVTSTIEGNSTIEYYYWSRGGAAGIDGVKADGGASQWFDLRGHRLAAKPTSKGIYIHDGKKMIVK